MNPNTAARALAREPAQRAALDTRTTVARVRLASLLAARGTNHARTRDYVVMRLGDEIHVSPVASVPVDQLAAWPEIDA